MRTWLDSITNRVPLTVATFCDVTLEQLLVSPMEPVNVPPEHRRLLEHEAPSFVSLHCRENGGFLTKAAHSGPAHVNVIPGPSVLLQYVAFNVLVMLDKAT